ncbi:MAG: tetratricopeptide repeat protein [Limisphaerales bacterium]
MNPRRKTSRSWAGILLAFAAVGMGIAVAAAFFFIGREKARDEPVADPAPPIVDTTGFDPVISAAIVEARRSILAAPGSPETWGDLGMVLFAHELFNPALECLLQAETLAPQDPRWPYVAGLARSVEDPAGAVAQLRRAVDLIPTPTSAEPGAWEATRVKLAEILFQLGSHAEARTLYQQVRTHRSDSGPAALGLGKIAAAVGQPDESVRLLEEAGRDPATRKAAYRLLLALHQRLDRAAEVERLTSRLNQLPDDLAWTDPFREKIDSLKTGENTWIDRADEWIQAGRVGDAAKLLEKTLGAYPDSDRARFFLGRARHRLGDLQGAESVLKQAISRSPGMLEAHMQLGVVCLARGRNAEARNAFQAALRTKPNLAEGWYNLGLSLGSEDRAASISAFREAIRLKPNLVEAYLGLAVVLRAENHADEAAVVLNQALALNPRDPLRQRILTALKAAPPR